ncbi:MAG: IclR family transcriptional regulator [Chloroflexi bacterium]|nr:IclR family transcriptional regulator [Chloroflexota bacterium]
MSQASVDAAAAAGRDRTTSEHATSEPKRLPIDSTAARALDVLSLFLGEVDSLALGDVTRLLSLNRAAAHRSLSTLRSRGFLEYSTPERRYRLGARFRDFLASSGRARLAEVALPYLERLRDATDETASLHVRDGWSRLCILWSESRQAVRRVADSGRPLPLYCGGSGPVLLSGLSDGELDRFLAEVNLAPLTPRTVTSPPQLRRVVERVRRQGYRISDRDIVADAIGVSAPVYDQTGRLLAAVGVSGPYPRCRREWAIAVLPLVKEAAQGISLALGWQPPGD